MQFKDTEMYKALKNFTYSGKTYFVGDEVSPQVAKVVEPSLTEKPKAKTKPTEISEGE